MDKKKQLGQVFTPKWVVDEILDSAGYYGKKILDKYIMEPASGDGAFLLSIVERFIDESLKAGHKSKKIKSNLAKYIYGIEIDPIEYKKSIKNLNNLVGSKFKNFTKIRWQIRNADTLRQYHKYFGFFDFVVGNPPYIRIHNLEKEMRESLKKEFVFMDGTIDIYLSFFEMGFKMLKKDGVLGYITPNSFLHNSSYKRFRDYLKQTRAITAITDFKSNKIFDRFSTYTAISIMQFNKNRDHFEYKELSDGKINKVADVYYKDIGLTDWSFSNTENLRFIKSLANSKGTLIDDYFNVQYGFATLRDNIFIGDMEKNDKETVYFKGYLIERAILKKIVKGSTFKGEPGDIKYIIFPYVEKNKRQVPIAEKDLAKNYPLAYKYLLDNKAELMKRDLDKGVNWYEFGRSQGVQSVHNEKFVCGTLIKDSVNFYKLPAEVMIYSGIFITKKTPNIGWDVFLDAVNSENFKRYIQITGKDFSGGYKSITSKQIKQFNLGDGGTLL